MKLKRGLIVSCQAVKGESLYNLGIMKYFAKAALDGGAVGIRCGVDDVVSIKEYLNNVPTIGLEKSTYESSSVYITPTKEEVDHLLATKTDVIALDATLRPRPNGETLEGLVEYIRSKDSEVEIMADIATLEEAVNAEKLGFDYIGCTLRGYTEETKGIEIPDFEFIKKLASTITKSKVIVEGGIWEKWQLEEVVKVNPYAVVIGSSITRPSDITKRFNSVMNLK